MAKFLRIVMVLTICALALILAGEAGLISVTWAAKGGNKPSKGPTYRTEYGYARLSSDGWITNDGRGQYIDCNLGGEDLVQIDIYDDDTLRRVDVYVGRIKYHYPKYAPSTRRVNFRFDVSNIGAPTRNAVHDILRWYRDTNGSQLERSGNYGFLDDGSVHAPIVIYGSNPYGKDASRHDQIQFVVDPNSDGEDSRAITETAVNAFYDDDEEDMDFWDTSRYRHEPDLVIY